jgi:MFS family permease
MTRDFRLVGFALLFWGIGEGLFIYFQTLYLEQLGANPVQIGGYLGLTAVVMAITHIPAGVLTDHLGPKRVMTAGWLWGLLAAVVMYMAPTLPVFVVGMMLYYSAVALVIAPLNSYLTTARGEWSVTRALTTSGAMYSTGAIVGSVLGGFIGEAIGLRSAYGLATVFFLVSTLLFLPIRSQPIEPPVGRGRYRALLSNAALGRFLGLASFALFAMFLSWPLTPNYLQNVRQIPLRLIGTLGSFNALGMVLLNLAIGRIDPRQGFNICHLVVGASILFLWLGTGIPWLALGYFLMAGSRTVRPLVTAQVENLVNRAELGLTYGLVETVASLTMVCAPPIAGVLYRAAPGLPFPVSLGMVGVSLLLIAHFGRRQSSPSVPVHNHHDL